MTPAGLSDYPIACSTPGCPNRASVKVAARWSDGLIFEFKTYALACPACTEPAYRAALLRQKNCRLALDETLEVTGIYALAARCCDSRLTRLADLEARLSSTQPTDTPTSTS